MFQLNTMSRIILALWQEYKFKNGLHYDIMLVSNVIYVYMNIKCNTVWT